MSMVLLLKQAKWKIKSQFLVAFFTLSKSLISPLTISISFAILLSNVSNQPQELKEL